MSCISVMMSNVELIVNTTAVVTKSDFCYVVNSISTATTIQNPPTPCPSPVRGAQSGAELGSLVYFRERLLEVIQVLHVVIWDRGL